MSDESALINVLPVAISYESNRESTCVAGEGFEPPKSVTADLQSAPFGRSGNLPCVWSAGNLARMEG